MLEQWVGFEAVERFGFLTIELEQEIALEVLIHSVVVVERPSLCGWSVEQVATECYVWLIVAQYAHECGQHIDLLRYHALLHAGFQ